MLERSADKSAIVSEVPADLAALLSPPAEALEKYNTQRVGEQLKTLFGLTKVEKKQGRRKRFWREAIAMKRAEEQEVDVKRIRIDNGPGVEVISEASSSRAPPVVHIGSVHPERDFERWLAERAGGVDTTKEAINQMKALINQLTAEGPDFIGKALSCLETLRRGCVREGEAEVFNNFARELRGPSWRRGLLWEKTQERGLGLISDQETAVSNVSEEAARAFLAGEEVSASASTPAGEQAGPPTERELEDMID